MHTTYTVTVPTFIKLLSGLKNVLAKAEVHAKEVGLSEEAFVNDRLAPDMFPLKKQVQVACDNAKGAVARLTGKEAPKMEDNEETFAELQIRIDKTLAFVQSVSEQDFAGAEERKIVLPYFPTKYMEGSDYALEYAVPNFIFHIVTAYGIVRKNGTPIGKADFVNGLPFKDL
ncbi:MAG TPA: DUF1993 domain-containing protein [Candidatus Paceibacterota bacterium]